MATQTETETPARFSTGPSTSANSSADIDIPRGSTTATLTFYAPPSDGSTPFNYVEKAPEGMPQRNYNENPHSVTVNDIRGHERDFDMNINGFSTASHITSAVTSFDDESQITSVYYPEIERLLLDHVPGSRRVYIFDHTIRRSSPDAKRAPVNRAHIDQTTRAAIERVRRHMGDEAEVLLEGRIRLINVWRPLNGPVVSNPLAFADSTSVEDGVVVPVEHRYPTRTGETAGIEFSEKMKWFYWSGMTNDERIFLQCFDSKDGARTPHSAFVDRRTKPEWPGRESIEVRALVFG